MPTSTTPEAVLATATPRSSIFAGSCLAASTCESTGNETRCSGSNSSAGSSSSRFVSVHTPSVPTPEIADDADVQDLLAQHAGEADALEAQPEGDRPA